MSAIVAMAVVVDDGNVGGGVVGAVGGGGGSVIQKEEPEADLKSRLESVEEKIALFEYVNSLGI